MIDVLNIVLLILGVLLYMIFDIVVKPLLIILYYKLKYKDEVHAFFYPLLGIFKAR